MSYAQKMVDFYCWRCSEYHWKTHPHYRAQKRRLARRKAAQAAGAENEHAAEQK